MRVVVLEDEPMVGSLMAAWMSGAFPDADVVQTTTAQDALAATADAPTDLLLTDLSLGGTQNGFEVGLAVKRTRPDTAVVLVTGHLIPHLLTRIPDELLHGWAYLVKSHHTTADLHRFITAALDGGVVLDADLVRNAVVTGDSKVGQLTPTELDVLRYVAAGQSNAGIATLRGMSTKSVEHTLSNIYAKLGIDSRNTSINPRVRATLIFCNASSFLTPLSS
jgi:DNA-binding NarL/FixJ family response regulator